MRMVKAELIERYCRGELTPDEHLVFVQWMDSDPALRQEVTEYMQLSDVFKQYRDRNRLQEKLNAIHDEMETESFRFASQMKKVDVVNVSPIKRIFSIGKNQFSKVAAAIAVLLVASALVGVGINRLNVTRSQSAYQELRREVEDIKRKQSVQTAGGAAAAPSGSTSTYTGSGIAIDPSGLVLTSHHLIAGARTIYISNQEFESLPMELVYSDASLDMAVLKVVDSMFTGFAEMGYGFRKSVADPGERIYTLGYPREDMVYGEGSISSYTGFEGDSASYQMSIPVNPGNSGGPVFDTQGNLIGIVSGRNANAEGASFAIKSAAIVSSLNASEEPEFRVQYSGRLRGLDRPAQVKRLRRHVFMVKVSN